MVNLEEEFKKNPDLKKEDIQHLKQWKSKQPHLPDISDEQLALFLHSCYFRLEPTKATIESHYTIKTHATEIFSNRSVSDNGVKEALKTVSTCVLPGLTKEGYKVFFIHLARTEPELYVLADVLKVHHMITDLWHYKYGSTAGDVCIFDMSGITFGHVGRLNMNVMKKNLLYLQDGMVTRLKAIHLVNVVPFVDMIMNMMKPFMNNELLSLFHYHQCGSEEIFKYVSKDMIPADRGGSGRAVRELHEETIKFLNDHATWFVQEETQRVDESKRQGKPKNSGELFGIEGSFKKLDVD